MDATTDDGSPIVERIAARAALAGNPSDGYSGAVFAMPVHAYAATVTLRSARRWSIADDISAPQTFDHSDDLQAAALDLSADDPNALVLATTAEFLQRTGTELRPCSIDVASSIPVSVGLAGSSAIVLGTLRALYRAAGSVLPSALSLATMAWGIEVRRLGITAGLQDRLVQSFGQPLLMRFDQVGDVDIEQNPSSEVIARGAGLRFLIAHRHGMSEPSQVVHGDLRRRFDAGDPVVRTAMSGLLAHAISAGSAFAAGDPGRLGDSMDATFDLRAEMIDLAPGHVAMIHAARRAGASANYTGSGGAIVVSSPSDAIDREARQSLKRLGCEVVAVDAGLGAR